MKNKLLAIAIASALSSLWSTSLLADGNGMDIQQKNSLGNIEATQKGTTTNSHITIEQAASDKSAKVTITQDNAVSSNTTVKQYNGKAIAGTDGDGNTISTGSTVTITQSGGNKDAPNLVNVQQGTSDDADSNQGNTFTITTQAGSGNKIIGYSGQVTAQTDGTVSSGDAVANSFATQSGAGNQATLTQQGATSTMGFTQTGTDNTATLSQDTDTKDSTMNVSQDGTANNIKASQVGAAGSDVNILVKQGNNEVIADQNASDSSMMVTVDGNTNSATLKQDFTAATGSNMILAQSGNNNMADMAQYDGGNFMSLQQTNDSNTARLTQNGTNDSMTVSQDGKATVTLTQGDATTP